MYGTYGSSLSPTLASQSMARKNRRDCRVGLRKKREASQRAHASVEAIKKNKKLGKTANQKEEPRSELTAAAASFLEEMKADVKRTTKAMVEQAEQTAAPL